MSSSSAVSHSAFRYMTRFQCIGPECENTCCRGWEVQINQVHYKKLEKTLQGATGLARPVDKLFRRLKKDPTRSRGKYALVVLNEDGSCPFLQEDLLCILQGRYGEDILPDTCALYPRSIGRSGGRLELTGAVSCPEVARQLLLRSDAMDLVETEPSRFTRPVVTFELGDHPKDPYTHFHDELRNLAFDLLSDAHFPLSSRLFFLGYFANRTLPFLYVGAKTLDESTLGAEVDRMQAPGMLQELHTRFEAIAADVTLPAEIILSLLGVRASLQGAGGFRALVESIVANYGVREKVALKDGSLEWSAADLSKAYARAKAPIVQAHGRRIDEYFTNYAKNYWAREWYSQSPNLLAHTVQLLVRTAVLRFLFFGHPLLGSSTDAQVDATTLDRAIVDTTSKFSRAFEHDAAFSKKLLGHLGQEKLLTLANAVCLAKF